jgi:thioredoxin reductase
MLEHMTQNEGTERYDVVVVGGGAAGLAGALALVRSKRAVLVVDGGRPRNAPSPHLHNYLTRDGAAPAEIAALGRAEVLGYGGRIEAGDVRALARDGAGFRVELADRTVAARRLLVATGATDELPDVPGLAEHWGASVVHCPYCHGWEVRDQPIAVLATSGFAVHQALMFRQLSDRVWVVAPDGLRATDDEREQLDALGIPVLESRVLGVEADGAGITGLRLVDRVLPVQVIAVQTVVRARAELLAPLGLLPEDVVMGDTVLGTQIEADPTGATSVPGVWVAGNVAAPSAQVISSASAGLMAGARINADLIAEDASRAVEKARALSVA